MYDNFAIMTRSVDSTDEGVHLNNDYIEAVFKRQKTAMEQQKTCLDSIGNSITEFRTSWNNNFPRMAELEEAVLDVQRLVSKLVKGKQPEKEAQQIPTFTSLHPQTTIQHSCNAQASPEIMEGIKTMTNTISSMASQMATMQSTISKMEKQLSGKSIQTITPPMTQQPSQPPQQPAHTFIPRTPTPRVQTPRPKTPCQGHSSLDAPSELNPPQRIPSPLLPHYYGADHLKTTTFKQTSASKTSACLITLETF